jgi:hypothetical protein
VKQTDVAFGLALLAEHSRSGTCPDPELLWWLIDSVALAVRDGVSVDQAMGIRNGGKSVIRSARLLARNACLLQARALLTGSDLAVSNDMATRIKRLQAGEPVRDEADGLLLLAVERGASGNPETIRKLLRELG